MEQIAQNAERDSIKYKMVEFMGDKIGEEFDAHISGITSYGIYANIDENHCEGMIPMREASLTTTTTSMKRISASSRTPSQQVFFG